LIVLSQYDEFIPSPVDDLCPCATPALLEGAPPEEGRLVFIPSPVDDFCPCATPVVSTPLSPLIREVALDVLDDMWLLRGAISPISMMFLTVSKMMSSLVFI
jgi:hypothetical protein